MNALLNIFENNKQWIAKHLKDDPVFFDKLAKGQSPKILIISCSDSRVVVREMMGMGVGESFMHCNVANLAPKNDINSATVIDFAVNKLQIEDIIICGHYECAGVKIVLDSEDDATIGEWLRPLKKLLDSNKKYLQAITNPRDKYDRFVELNVEEQCRNVLKNKSVQKSISKWGLPRVHGIIFDVRTGRLKDLKVSQSLT